MPLHDQTALRRAIETLARDPAAGVRMGERARRRVEREFDRKVVLQSLLDFYQIQLGMSVAMG